MSKSFNTLSALVLEMGQDVEAAAAFLFVGKWRRRAKVLWFDGTGLCLLAERLERDRFAAVWEQAEVTSSELEFFSRAATRSAAPRPRQREGRLVCVGRRPRGRLRRAT